MVSKTRVKKTIGSSLQNLPAPLAALAAQFSTLPIAWSLAIASATGLLATFRELAEDRGRELLVFIEENQEKFVDRVVKSPNFIAVFLNVWEMHIRETAESKRARLRNFLLSVGCAKPIPEDIHTKIYSVVEQMTDKEAEIFGVIFRNCNRQQFREMHINSTSFPELSKYEETELKDAWHSLHSYRLINITDATMGNIMAVQQITPFGELFYDFVITGPSG